jgi:hypothetical protein
MTPSPSPVTPATATTTARAPAAELRTPAWSDIKIIDSTGTRVGNEFGSTLGGTAEFPFLAVPESDNDGNGFPSLISFDEFATSLHSGGKITDVVVAVTVVGSLKRDGAIGGALHMFLEHLIHSFATDFSAGRRLPLDLRNQYEHHPLPF